MNIKPEDLDRNKLTLVSLGSVCGIGIGVILGLFWDTFWYQLIFGLVILIIGLITVFQNIYLLVKVE